MASGGSVLHYHSTRGRTDPLWEHCRAMPLPDTLTYKVEQFARSGCIVLGSDELFKDSSGFAVLLGQGHHPRDYNPLIDAMKSEDNLAYLRRIRDAVRATASQMPEHLSFLSRH